MWNIITIHNKYFLFYYILKYNFYYDGNAEFNNLICWFVVEESFLIIISVKNNFTA